MLTALLLLSCHQGEPLEADPRDAGEETSHDGEGQEDGSADALGDGGADALGDADRPDLLLECDYPTEGYGYREGRALEPFDLWDCEGEGTTLPRLWCDRDVTIVHVSVAYCSSCLGSIEALNQIVDEQFEQADLALVELLVEMMPEVNPGLEECEYWSRSFEPSVSTYIPPAGTLEGPLLYFADSDALPLTVVLDRTGVVRIWTSVSLPVDFVERVDALLD